MSPDPNTRLVNQNVVIDSNVVLNRTTPNLPVPDSAMHGIFNYNGCWKNVSVKNNTVVTNSWHGISSHGVDGLDLEKNIVIAHNPKKLTWISTDWMSHEGVRSSNVVMHYNITTSIDQTPQKVSGVIVPPPTVGRENNLDLTAAQLTLQDIFKTFDIMNDKYDFTLLPNTAATAIFKK